MDALDPAVIADLRIRILPLINSFLDYQEYLDAEAELSPTTPYNDPSFLAVASQHRLQFETALDRLSAYTPPSFEHLAHLQAITLVLQDESLPYPERMDALTPDLVALSDSVGLADFLVLPESEVIIDLSCL